MHTSTAVEKSFMAVRPAATDMCNSRGYTGYPISHDSRRVPFHGDCHVDPLITRRGCHSTFSR